MKRFLLALFFIVVSAGAYAQYRDVKLPEQPKQKGYRDYSTEDAGFWFAVEAEGGSSIMEHKKNMQYTNLLVTGGYRLNEYLRAGVGFGHGRGESATQGHARHDGRLADCGGRSAPARTGRFLRKPPARSAGDAHRRPRR